MQTTLYRYIFLSLSLFAFYAAPAFAQAPTISWDALQPDRNIQYDDPFSKLSPDQLLDLRTIARIRWLIASGKSPADGVSAKSEQRLVKHLADQGIDADRLLSLREKVAAERRKKHESTGGGVMGTAIRIPGYVVPLFPDQKEVRDFLLVPWMAPCAHFPPPPGNQVIHVTMDRVCPTVTVSTGSGSKAPWIESCLGIWFSSWTVSSAWKPITSLKENSLAPIRQVNPMYWPKAPWQPGTRINPGLKICRYGSPSCLPGP
nr:DUF3299 domain-containing protein [uncultured Desulfobacter sp.]